MSVEAYIPIVFLFIASLVFLVRVLVYQQRLSNYLRTHYMEKWKELTTISGVGPGFANPWRGLPFLFGPEDLGDPEVLRLKLIVRNSCIYTVTGFLATFLMAVIMIASTVGLKFG